VNILQPGPGVGGHCIAVDPWFIVSSAPEEAKLIRTAREVNDSKPDFVVQKVKEAAAQLKEKPTIGCLGLTYKANIDDLRESPAVYIVQKLIEQEVGKILAVEPYLPKLPMQWQEINVIDLVDLEYALENSDIVVKLVDHNNFQKIDWESFTNIHFIDTKK
jgi:UDP-N-acetyl-D-mannosaminuronic acid dehydrogenase